ncbi:exopolysaccharide phosphotransferase [Ceratobasidium sp. AG-Ba]|nr:exopolysaccharide phosphotransferase [Ceratobasidium sp. AG-Ba]
MSRFWSAPGSGLPTVRAPVHRRKPSTEDLSHRTVIYIYWPSSRLAQGAIVLSACAFVWLLAHLASPHSVPKIAKVPEPGWLSDSFLDGLVQCEKDLLLPSPDARSYIFPTTESRAHLASTYRPLRLGTHQLVKSLPQRASLGLPLSCLEDTVARGEPCAAPDARRSPPLLDIVWTWANGSDPLHHRARRMAEMSELRFIELPRGAKKVGAEEKLFREHDELRHSIRSVQDHFGRSSKWYHILASDFPFPACNSSTAQGMRLGQVPQWLDLGQTSWSDNGVSLNLVHHSEFMSDYRQTTFSSLGIESQFANLNVSDVFVHHQNDDVFFMAPLTSWDFYTYAYGPVLRMQSDLMVPPTNRETRKANGEWQTLQYSNKLLGDRFGQRYRPYTTHEAKTLVKSMVDEVTITWHSQLHQTGQQPFRLNPDVEDAYLPFLATHWTVERHREALLWSWVVARIGGDDDEWGPAQSEQAWRELGGAPKSDSVDVRRAARTTLYEDRVMGTLDSTGDATIGRSQYAYVSRDGYPYTSLGRFGWKTWPVFQPSRNQDQPGMYSDPAARCTISRTECLDVHDSRIRGASGIFKQIAFDVSRCGDCIVTALVAASGPLGFSAFLPEQDRKWTRWKDAVGASETVAPHLPLVADYRAANFTLESVLAVSKNDKGSVRDWAMELIARYRFTIAITPSHFAMLRQVNANAMKALFNRLEEKTHADDTVQSIAMLCLNDDIVFQPAVADRTMREWEARKFPRKASWEL